MPTLCKKSLCSGCGACASACALDAIALFADEKGFLYPQVDAKLCVDCRACEKVCPVLNRERFSCETLPGAAIAKDENVSSGSSSGGIFPLLAKKTLVAGGVVFGAVFNEKFNVRHDYTEKLEDLPRFCRSKYVQSDCGKIFREVKKFLAQDRRVLFCGTPCQVAGLRSFLGEKANDEKLLGVSFICHGVPSPEVWRKYLAEKRVELCGEISGVNFRFKQPGDRRFFLRIDTAENSAVSSAAEDVYVQLFLRDLALRDSCFNCRFRGEKNFPGDIILGDFWSRDEMPEAMQDREWPSLVILRSEKGKKSFQEISGEVEAEFMPGKKAAKCSITFKELPKWNFYRKRFFRDYRKFSCAELLAKYGKKNPGSGVTSFIGRVWRFVSRRIKKVFGK